VIPVGLAEYWYDRSVVTDPPPVSQLPFMLIGRAVPVQVAPV
jgi:hypothetical protein